MPFGWAWRYNNLNSNISCKDCLSVLETGSADERIIAANIALDNRVPAQRLADFKAIYNSPTFKVLSSPKRLIDSLDAYFLRHNADHVPDFIYEPVNDKNIVRTETRTGKLVRRFRKPGLRFINVSGMAILIQRMRSLLYRMPSNQPPRLIFSDLRAGAYTGALPADENVLKQRIDAAMRDKSGMRKTFVRDLFKFIDIFLIRTRQYKKSEDHRPLWMTAWDDFPTHLLKSSRADPAIFRVGVYGDKGDWWIAVKFQIVHVGGIARPCYLDARRYPAHYPSNGKKPPEAGGIALNLMIHDPNVDPPEYIHVDFAPDYEHWEDAGFWARRQYADTPQTDTRIAKARAQHFTRLAGTEFSNIKCHQGI